MNSNQFQQDKDNAKADDQMLSDFSNQFHSDCDEMTDAMDSKMFFDAQSQMDDQADFQRQVTSGFSMF